jgi:hypothetical protein
MRSVVLVAWRGSDAFRQRAWEKVQRFWIASGFALYTGGETQTGPFNRSAARNEAARSAGPWDLAIIADADCFLRPENVAAGLALAQVTGLAVMPFDRFTALTRGETSRALRGRLTSLPERDPVEPAPAPGGCIIVPRPLWDEVGGYDERFVGWGYEDSAFYVRLGGAIRLPGRLWHLWHPPAREADPSDPQHRRNAKLACEEYGRDPDTGDWPALWAQRT